MDNNFIEEAASKTIEQLREIAVNFDMYRGALVAAAKQELTNRGIELTDEEKAKIENIKNKRKYRLLFFNDSNLMIILSYSPTPKPIITVLIGIINHPCPVTHIAICCTVCIPITTSSYTTTTYFT